MMPISTPWTWAPSPGAVASAPTTSTVENITTVGVI